MKTQKRSNLLNISALALAALSASTAFAVDEVKQTPPFTALRVASPAQKGISTFLSNAGAVSSGVGDFDTPFDVNYLEQFIKSDYMHEDLRIVLAFQALSQLERSSEVSDDVKKAAAPVIATWKKNACVALLTIQKANLSTVPVGSLCPDTDSSAIKDSSGQRATYVSVPLALPGVAPSAADIATMSQAMASAQLKPLRDFWAKAYSALFTSLYWEFFDAAVKDWTWKQVLQSEALRMKLHAPIEREMTLRYNVGLATVNAASVSVTDANMINIIAPMRPEYVSAVQYLYEPFETDAKIFSYNYQSFKFTELRERMRSEFSQAVISYLVEQRDGGGMQISPDGLRQVDAKSKTTISTSSYADLKVAIGKDPMLASLVTPGQLSYEKVQVIVDTAQSKATLAKMLGAKLTSAWMDGIQNDIKLSINVAKLDTIYIEQQITDSYAKAMQVGFSASINNQILLYELALEIKKSGLNLDASVNAVGTWTQNFLAAVAKHDMSSTKNIESDYADIFNEVAANGDKTMASKGFRNLVEFRTLDSHDRMLLEEETRFVGNWKTKSVSAASTLIGPIGSMGQDIASLQADSTLKFKVKSTGTETTALMGQDPFIEGLANKIFLTRDWKVETDFKNLVAVHFDTNLKEGVYIFVANKVNASKILSAFDKQQEIGEIYSNQAYGEAFKRLQADLLKDYVIEIQLKDGKLLQADSPELLSYLTK